MNNIKMKKNPKALLKNNHGFTLTEVLVGVGLLMLVAVGGLTAFDQLGKLMASNEVSSTADDRIIEIIENIRQHPTTQIVQYTDDANKLIYKENLEMAWSNEVDTTAANCTTCPGRYGYVITPISNAMGDLYLVTVMFTHKEWDQPKKFEFVVSK